MSSSQPRTAPAVELTAGCAAGVVSTAVAHPLDLIKTRLQLNTTTTAAFGHSLRLARRILGQEGGASALYRGIGPNLIGNASSWAIYFVLYEECKTLVSRHQAPGGLSFHHYFLASGVAGAITSALTNPIWVIKTRMLSTAAGDAGAYASTAHGVRQILREDGVRGFYRGLVPSLFGVANGALQFMVYEQLKKARTRSLGRGGEAADAPPRLSTLDYLWCSGLSKVVAGAATYPYQVIRARLQMHGAESAYGGARDVVAQVWRREGPLGLYKGLGPNLLRVVPSTCVTFVVYESTKGFLLRE